MSDTWGLTDNYNKYLAEYLLLIGYETFIAKETNNRKDTQRKFLECLL
ncbi:MAG: hypothetical protein IKJ36_07710 [Clostridia bacterium]|nr:hypothetical protein [Clostridia bacterium]